MNLLVHETILVPPANSVVRVDVSVYGIPVQFEQLWTERVHGDVHTIKSIPLMAFGLSLGDSVEVDNDHSVTEVVGRSGNRTLRILMEAVHTEYEHQLVVDWVRSRACLHEWHGPILGVNVDPKDDFPDLVAIENLERLGRIVVARDTPDEEGQHWTSARRKEPRTK